jgi:hypothetical protein
MDPPCTGRVTHGPDDPDPPTWLSRYPSTGTAAHAGWPDPNSWATLPSRAFRDTAGARMRSYEERCGAPPWTTSHRTATLPRERASSDPLDPRSRGESRHSRSLGAVGRLGRRRQRPGRRSSPCSSSEGTVATALPLAASRMTTARKQSDCRPRRLASSDATVAQCREPEAIPPASDSRASLNEALLGGSPT